VSDASLWIALASCLIASYIAAINIALKTFSRTRLSDYLDGLGKGEHFERLLQRKSKLILITGTIRMGLSLVILLAVLSYITAWYPDLGMPMQYLAALVVAGGLVSIFGVSVPVSWAKYHPEGLLARSVWLLSVCWRLFLPGAKFLLLFDPVVRRISGASERLADNSHLSDEILSVVERHDDQGHVDEDQKEMLEAVVDLPSITVGEIMTPRTDIEGIDAGSSLEQVKADILKDGHSRIPVYDESLDHIVGILYAKDMIRFIGNAGPFDLRKQLRDVLMVPETKSIRELLSEFKAKKVHIAIVLDEYGGTAGLVTIEDILEEIVGEIHDEYELLEEGPDIQRVDDVTVEVDARVHIDDLNDELGLDLPEDEDYETVGGYVFSTLGHIPDMGECIELEGVRITVIGAQRTKVTRIRIEMLEQRSATKNGGAVPESDQAAAG